jgi:hypothetical protein
MRRSVAGQTIGAQLVSAADGSPFTGSVTVYVTGDGGTQAIGSTGSGVCTHEGNGYHTYVPAQSETDFSHIAFTFIGTGAVPATIQVYTRVDANVVAADPDAALAPADLADTILSRSVAINAEDTAGVYSLCYLILAATEASRAGSTITVKKSDGSTTFATRTITTAAANPVTGVS